MVDCNSTAALPERARWMITLAVFTPHKYDIRGRSDRRPRARLRFDPTFTSFAEALTQAQGCRWIGHGGQSRLSQPVCTSRNSTHAQHSIILLGGPPARGPGAKPADAQLAMATTSIGLRRFMTTSA